MNILLFSYILKASIMASFGMAAVKGRLDYLCVCLILSLPLGGYLFSSSFFTFYTDTLGEKTHLGLKSIMLVTVFLIMLIKDKAWLKEVRNKRFFCWSLSVLSLCGLYTQVYHLGAKAGFGVVFIRILQPIIFMVVIGYVCTTLEGLKKIWLSIIGAVFIMILFRYLGESQEFDYVERVSSFISWTMYGTILTSTIPLAVALILTGSNITIRLSMIFYTLVAIAETTLTKTRGAILSLPLVTVLIWKHSKLLSFTLLIAIAIMVLFLPNQDVMPDFGTRVFSFNPFEYLQDRNWLSRVDRNIDALRFISENPIGGLGLGAPTVWSGHELAFWVYNPYLHWGVSMGVGAMAAFAVLMAWSLLEACRNYSREQTNFKMYQLAIIVSLLIWMVNQFTTGDSLTYLHKWESTLFFYVLIGMILGQKERLERQEKST